MKTRRTCLIVALVVLIPIVCLLMGLLAFLLGRGQAEQTASSLADRLGRTPQNEIALESQCWDIMTRCGTLVIFSTPGSYAELDAQIAALGMDFSPPRRTDGYGVFTSVNLNTSRTLTADGSLGMTDRFDLPEPLAYEWQADLAGGKQAKITHYDLQSTGSVYALDGVPLSDNIVVVLVQDRP
jgi:hypothetical protein